MTTEAPPTILSRAADRAYDVLSSVDDLARLFKLLGFTYQGRGKTTDLWQHRWYHVGPAGKTMLVLFKPHGGRPPRLVLLGPQLDAVDTLTTATVEESDDGGRWVAFGGARC